MPGILRQTKICDHCCSIPSQIGGWLLIWGATSLNHLYIARAITGVGIGAGVPIASIYMRWVELSNTHTNILPLTIEKNIDLILQRNLNPKTSRNPGHSNACGCQHRYTLEDILLITNT